MAETSGRIRLGFVGGEHLHFGGLLTAALVSPTAEVVGVVIADDELRGHIGAEHPELVTFATAEEFYATTSPQAIVTCADNRRAAQVVADAAARGLHVMKEKPMAADIALAEQMATAAARHGVRLMINWPTHYNAAIHTAKRLVDEGAIGRVLGIYHRAGHGGPPADFADRGPVGRIGWGWLIDRDANGGGAAVDFCSYGAVLARWFMGQPSTVVALGGRYAKDFFTVEDNATMLLGYPRGHCVIEGSWTQPAVPMRMPTMIYGESGAIGLAGGQVSVANTGGPGQVSATEATTVAVDPLPTHYKSAPDYFTYCLLHDEPFSAIVSPEYSRDAQEILDAGLASMTSGTRISLPLPTFAR